MFKAMAIAAALAASTVAPATADAAQGQKDLVITKAGDRQLSDFLWLARLLVIFADSPNDPRFVQQMGYIEASADDLASRDVIVITDTDPVARSAIREELRPRGFDLVLIGKDGMKYLRRPLPQKVRDISASIDKLPLRLQELRDMRASE